jgi:hypothetical protein
MAIKTVKERTQPIMLFDRNIIKRGSATPASDAATPETRRAPRRAPRPIKVPAETCSRANIQPPAFGAAVRISAAIRGTVAFPVPTSRAVFLVPAPAFKDARTAASRSAETLGRPKAPSRAT